MSWAWTETSALLSNGPYPFSLYETNAICGNTASPVYYSTNGGQTWAENESGILNLDTFSLSSSNGVACRTIIDGEPIYYTSDGGLSWTESETSFSGANHRAVAVASPNAILARTDGIWASSDSGATWTLEVTDETALSVAMADSSHAIVGTLSGIYYTDDGGQNWTPALATSSLFDVLTFSGTYALASGSSSQGIYYSTDSGHTWQQSSIATGNYNLAVNSLGQGIASNASSGGGVLYTTDGGATWTNSNLNTGGRIFVLSMTTTGALAACSNFASVGIFYSVNGGATWTPSANVNDGLTSSIALVGNNALANLSLGNNGIAYSSGPLCFHRDTMVLCENNQYRPIHELRVGDKVVTYRHDLVPIKHIASTELINGLFSQPSAFLYRHRTIPGLQVSGEHRILVRPQVFHPRARVAQKRLHGLDANLPENKVDGLLMRMACFHPEFERVDDREVFTMYHLVLEHENEPMRHYGIYVNGGVIAETCHEAGFHQVTKQQQK